LRYCLQKTKEFVILIIGNENVRLYSHTGIGMPASAATWPGLQFLIRELNSVCEDEKLDLNLVLRWKVSASNTNKESYVTKFLIIIITGTKRERDQRGTTSNVFITIRNINNMASIWRFTSTTHTRLVYILYS
jgi:hypothetical protein